MRVKDYEQYELDPIKGKIYNHRTGRYVGHLDSDGYIKVTLTDGINKSYTVRVHQLMAQHFIPNPDNKSEVNHINHIRDDNRVSNLEWSTRVEQHDDEWKKNQGKSILVFEEGFSQEYPSITVASENLVLDKSSLVKVAKGKQKHTKGYKVEYIEE